MFNNKQIEAGAKAIAEDMTLPGGSRKKLARVVGDHLAWFDVVEARGLTWGDISRLLFAAGAKSKNGRPISIGTLSSAVWRKRGEAKAPTSSPQSALQHRALNGQTNERRIKARETPLNRTIANKDSQARTPRVLRATAKPENNTPPEIEPTSKEQTLAFMKRAASIRRSRSD